MLPDETKYNKLHKAFHKEVAEGMAHFRASVKFDITDQLEYDRKHGRANKAPKVLEALTTNGEELTLKDLPKIPH